MALEEPHDEELRAPDWAFALGAQASPLSPEHVKQLAEIAEAGAALAAHERATARLAARLEERVKAALDAGLSVEDIADRGNLQIDALRAYHEGRQGLYFGGQLYVPGDPSA